MGQDKRDCKALKTTKKWHRTCSEKLSQRNWPGATGPQIACDMHFFGGRGGSLRGWCAAYMRGARYQRHKLFLSLYGQTVCLGLRARSWNLARALRLSLKAPQSGFLVQEESSRELAMTMFRDRTLSKQRTWSEKLLGELAHKTCLEPFDQRTSSSAQKTRAQKRGHRNCIGNLHRGSCSQSLLCLQLGQFCFRAARLLVHPFLSDTSHFEQIPRIDGSHCARKDETGSTP